jgi:peptidyl-prolyl cis-trans isomerase B (cyclophilin B)
MPTRSVSLLVLIAALAALTGCGAEDGSSPSASDQSKASGPSTKCSYPGASDAAKKASNPPTTAASSGTVTVTFATTLGDLNATLDRSKTPCTVNSFLSLADQGYFDNTTCHRVTMPDSGISVLQCGDPSETGTGGPGYSFADELNGKETYAAGTLAMANAGPDTNGSQFFIVYGDSRLPPDYNVFGSVDAASTELIADAAAKGTTTGDIDGKPKVPVDIKTVTAS